MFMYQLFNELIPFEIRLYISEIHEYNYQLHARKIFNNLLKDINQDTFICRNFIEHNHYMLYKQKAGRYFTYRIHYKDGEICCSLRCDKCNEDWDMNGNVGHLCSLRTYKLVKKYKLY